VKGVLVIETLDPSEYGTREIGSYLERYDVGFQRVNTSGGAFIQKDAHFHRGTSVLGVPKSNLVRRQPLGDIL